MQSNSKYCNLSRYSALWEVEKNFPLLKCGLQIEISSQGVQCGWGKRVTFQRRNLTDMTSARWSGSTSMVMSYWQNLPWIRCDDNSTLSLWSSSPTLQSQSNHEMNNQWVSAEGHYTKYLTRSPRNCQDHQKQGMLEK